MWTESQLQRAAERLELIRGALQPVVTTVAKLTYDPDVLEANCADLRGLIFALDKEVFRIFRLMESLRDENRPKLLEPPSTPKKHLTTMQEIEDLFK